MNKNSKQLVKDKLEMKLAVKRTEMSCQRSLLSYIRTACVFVSLAFTYLKIAVYDKFDAFVIIMFAIGLCFLVIGIVEYFIIRKSTKKLYREYKRVDEEDELHEEG